MPPQRISFHNHYIGFILYLKIFLLTMILTGCATKIPDHEVKPIHEYQHAQLISGLTIAIHPFIDTEEVEDYFGTDLLSQNILAVLVVVENSNSKSSYVISNDKFSLSNSDLMINSSPAAKRTLGDSSADNVANASAYAGSSLFAVMALSEIMSTDNINQNIKTIELHKRTVSPSETEHGVVYFMLPDNTANMQSTWVFHVDALSLQTKENVNFNIMFDWNRK